MATTPAPTSAPTATARKASTATLFVKNNMPRLVTLGGVALAPNAVSEVPNDADGVNKRDVEDFEGLELISKTDAEGKSTIESRDVLHPDNSQPTINNTPDSGWQMPGSDAAATSAAAVAKPADVVKETKATQKATT